MHYTGGKTKAKLIELGADFTKKDVFKNNALHTSDLTNDAIREALVSRYKILLSMCSTPDSLKNMTTKALFKYLEGKVAYRDQNTGQDGLLSNLLSDELLALYRSTPYREKIKINAHITHLKFSFSR